MNPNTQQPQGLPDLSSLKNLPPQIAMQLAFLAANPRNADLQNSFTSSLMNPMMNGTYSNIIGNGQNTQSQPQQQGYTPPQPQANQESDYNKSDINNIWGIGGIFNLLGRVGAGASSATNALLADAGKGVGDLLGNHGTGSYVNPFSNGLQALADPNQAKYLGNDLEQTMGTPLDSGWRDALNLGGSVFGDPSLYMGGFGLAGKLGKGVNAIGKGVTGLDALGIANDVRKAGASKVGDIFSDIGKGADNLAEDTAQYIQSTGNTAGDISGNLLKNTPENYLPTQADLNNLAQHGIVPGKDWSGNLNNQAYQHNLLGQLGIDTSQRTGNELINIGGKGTSAMGNIEKELINNYDSAGHAIDARKVQDIVSQNMSKVLDDSGVGKVQKQIDNLNASIDGIASDVPGVANAITPGVTRTLAPSQIGQLREQFANKASEEFAKNGASARYKAYQGIEKDLRDYLDAGSGTSLVPGMKLTSQQVDDALKSMNMTRESNPVLAARLDNVQSLSDIKKLQQPFLYAEKAGNVSAKKGIQQIAADIKRPEQIEALDSSGNPVMINSTDLLNPGALARKILPNINATAMKNGIVGAVKNTAGKTSNAIKSIGSILADNYSPGLVSKGTNTGVGKFLGGRPGAIGGDVARLMSSNVMNSNKVGDDPMADNSAIPSTGISSKLMNIQKNRASLTSQLLASGVDPSKISVIVDSKFPQLSSSEKDNITAANSALQSVADLKQQYYAMGNAGNPLGSVQDLLGGIGLDGARKTYNNSVDALISSLARTFGQTGNLTEQEQMRMKNLVPNATDNQQQAAKKFNLLEQFINNKMQNTASLAGY